MAHFVGVYWGPRRESRQSCADRISALLHALETQDGALSTWFKKVASRKAALVSLPIDADRIGPVLKTSRRDVGHDVIPELGFRFTAWTGPQSASPATLAATCGAHDRTVVNHVVLSFSREASPAPDLLRQILAASVKAFDPDDGVVSSSELLAGSSSPPWMAPAVLRYKRGFGFSTD